MHYDTALNAITDGNEELIRSYQEYFADPESYIAAHNTTHEEVIQSLKDLYDQHMAECTAASHQPNGGT